MKAVRWASPTPSAATDSADSGADDHAARVKPSRKRAKSGSKLPVVVARSPSLSSPASSSSDGGIVAASKARRPTYLLQKEERDDLVEEMRLLEARLELLKVRAGVSTARDDKSVASLTAAKANAEQEIHDHQVHLARFHSLITLQLQTTEVFPLAIHIHLPIDPTMRHRVLENMRELKLRRATEVALNRIRLLDQTQPYKHLERQCTRGGLHHMNYYEVQQFRGLADARQLYDLLVHFQAHIEISVSEMIGQIAVREDQEDEDLTVWNSRVVTSGELGGVEELNTVAFARFHDHFIPHNAAQFGIVTVDTVDEDELYPYKPHERTRKDVQAVYSVSEYRAPESNAPVVVLTSHVFMTQLPPQFPLPADVLENLVETMPRWIDVMNAFLRQSTGAT